MHCPPDDGRIFGIWIMGNCCGVQSNGDRRARLILACAEQTCEGFAMTVLALQSSSSSAPAMPSIVAARLWQPTKIGGHSGI